MAMLVANASLTSTGSILIINEQRVSLIVEISLLRSLAENADGCTVLQPATFFSLFSLEIFTL
jgi:hypothetical protein